MGDMDSGNSGSMQSSSTGGGGGGGGGGGDDQEYESRGGGNESISAFYNPMSTFNLDNMGVAAASPPLQLYSFSNGSSSFAHHNHHQVVSNYFDNPTTTLDQCPNFMLNNHHNNNGTNNNNNNNNDNNQLDMVWPNKFATIAASIRPPPISTNDANCTTDGPLAYTITNNQQLQAPPRPTSLPSPPSAPPPPPVASSGTITSITGPGVRNPKKRSRASRRAPTTVLTTDTSNFRQMVQEFTGIPAPPFTGFSTRARFDLFNGLGLGLGSGPGSGHSNPPSVPSPSYLLRPLPQKMPPLHQPPFSANSSLPSHTTTSTGTITNNTTSTSMNMTATVAPESTTFNLCDPDQNFMNTNSQQLNCLSSTPATLSHQNSCSVNPASGSYRGISTNTAAAVAAANGPLDNNGGATKGEGMVDSWICSSSD